MTRKPKFTITFGYAIEDGHFGETKPRILSYDDLEHTLLFLDPLKSISWMNIVRGLRRGGYTIIELYGNSENGNMKRVFKITRN